MNMYHVVAHFWYNVVARWLGYLILVEWTGAEGSMVPLILLASMSLVWVESAEMPWYSWIRGSNTSANTCNKPYLA